MLIDEHLSDLGGWSTAHRSASPAMRPFVCDMMGSRSKVPRPLRERRLPSPSVVLAINFAEPHRMVERSGADAAAGASAWIVGLQSGPWLSEAFGEREFMVAGLTPIGAHLILGIRMDLLADRIVELDEIDPRFARDLAARVAHGRGWQARFDALEAIFAERLSGQVRPALVLRALKRMSDGNVGLTALAAELGCSHRHLIAAFHEQVGLPPKKIARIARFNRTLAAINRTVDADFIEGKPYLEPDAPTPRGRGVDWADLALAQGYYDQAHFIKELRAFAGWSPSQLQAVALASAA